MKVVADTHALVWFLQADQHLSGPARAALEQAQADSDGGLVVSVASRIDLHYLVFKGAFSPEEARRIWAVTEDPSTNITAEPVTAAIAEAFGGSELAALPRDPWDRLIVSTARQLGVPLVTKDGGITSSRAVQVIW